MGKYISKYNISIRSFWKDFSETPVKGGEIAIGWLGQAGFVFKDSAGTIVGVDPYLTDSVEKNWDGFKRLMAPIVTPEEYAPDIYLATHWHEDHLDIDAVPAILNNGKSVLLSPQTSIDRVQPLDVPKSSYRLFKEGDKTEIKGISLEAVYADHGTMVPDSIGIYMIMEGVKIYIVGDTAYVPRVVEQAASFHPDIIIPPINGENGNLNSIEAARLAGDGGAKTVVPCHFWTFAEHRGDPQEFHDQARKLAPDTNVLIFCQGEIVLYKR
jgi:L-ascorbate 6-phosphate lactonase